MVRKMLRSTLLGIFMLTGCGTSILDNKDARCPFVDRGGCQSMEQVNQMVNERRFTHDGQFVLQARCVGACKEFK
ncbi:type IV conjugative transfer system protein TraV [Legionella septentrionalis]|nr:type IV conjugative transfer system protein TraV [Legionella septentrionalis]